MACRRVAAGCVLSLAGVAGVGTQAAEATVLCKKKSAVVVAREACRAKEASVSVGSTVPQVVDSAGRVLGVFVGGDAGNGKLNVIRNESGATLGFGVFPSEIAPELESYVHEWADCSGPRYIQSTQLVRVVQLAGVTGYYAGDPVQRRTVRATEFAADSCQLPATPTIPGYCCQPEFSSYEIDAGVPVAFDTSAFTPPFRIE